MNATRLLKALKLVYRPTYALLNLVIAGIYYIIIKQIIALQQFGIVFFTAPLSLVYLLIISSSILMTLSIYSIFNYKKNAIGYEGAGASGVCALATGIISGCGCQGAILYAFFAFFLGSGEAYLVNTTLAENIGVVVIALVVFNISFIVYSLSKVRVKK